MNVRTRHEKDEVAPTSNVGDVFKFDAMKCPRYCSFLTRFNLARYRHVNRMEQGETQLIEMRLSTGNPTVKQNPLLASGSQIKHGFPFPLSLPWARLSAMLQVSNPGAVVGDQPPLEGLGDNATTTQNGYRKEPFVFNSWR